MTDRDAKKELMRRAKDVDATVHVGKDGVGENLNNEITAQLKKRRLIKVKVLGKTDISGIADEIAKVTDSIAVDVRGGVIVLTDKRTWNSLCRKKFE